jgi:site-specific DNA-methyltransferase (adenine-specific)
MKTLVKQAFLTVHQGYAPDRVVADPELAAAFLAACSKLGMTEDPVTLNQSLLNLRKGGGLTGLPRSRRTSFANEHLYRFASEIAVRYMERKHGVSLDHIICDPILVQEFDRIAASLASGFSPLEYRWAALNLRKSTNLQPELLARVVRSEPIHLGPVAGLDVALISTKQGLYIFYAPEIQETLYVGESDNLRKRTEKHLEHSDNKDLARWLWEHGLEKICLEIHLLPDETSTRVRRALEMELIRSRRPSFNVQR